MSLARLFVVANALLTFPVVFFASRASLQSLLSYSTEKHAQKTFVIQTVRNISLIRSNIVGRFTGCYCLYCHNAQFVSPEYLAYSLKSYYLSVPNSGGNRCFLYLLYFTGIVFLSNVQVSAFQNPPGQN